MFFNHPLWIPRIEIQTKSLRVIRHVTVSVEVQRGSIFPNPSHEGRWRWYLLLKSNLGLHRGSDSWDYTLDLEGRGRGNTLAVGSRWLKYCLGRLSGRGRDERGRVSMWLMERGGR